MLEKLRAALLPGNNEATADADQRLAVAAAVLLFEVAKADFQVDAAEEAQVAKVLARSLDLEHALLDEVLQAARSQSAEAIALHPYTQLVHQNYSMEEKRKLMDCLWRVAYADGRLDKYEEYTLRRIAELIYLPHREFIQAKQRVLGSAGGLRSKHV